MSKLMKGSAAPKLFLQSKDNPVNYEHEHFSSKARNQRELGLEPKMYKSGAAPTQNELKKKLKASVSGG